MGRADTYDVNDFVFGVDTNGSMERLVERDTQIAYGKGMSRSLTPTKVR